MQRLASTLFLVALLTGCATTPKFEARTVPPPELKVAQEQVRGHAKNFCGRCHTASLPTAIPSALAIYDLDAPQWSSTLTAAQLTNGFPRRLNHLLDEKGQRELRTFIEGELALRP